MSVIGDFFITPLGIIFFTLSFIWIFKKTFESFKERRLIKK